MRKNLFLTLALALASFAGVNAQDWSVTLGAAEGLPGASVAKDGGNVMFYQSGIIRADKPIKTLRFTCAGNSTGNVPNGNNFRLMLSELNVYTADMSRELKYTVTSNADHNTLTKSFDGQGLKALYDGKYNNYFSSMSGAEGAVADFHYLELTFEEEIQRFIIEWGGKQGAGEYPTTVVLTEGGVAAEAYTDRSSSFSEDKITTIEGLENAGYFTICGNAPSTYNTYDNKTGELTSKDGPLAGSGPMYVTLGEIYAAEPTIDYLVQLLPAGNDTYYIYFPMQKKYLNGNATDNAFNDAQNGWQYATVHLEKAAKVKLNPLENGDFEMSYVTKKDEVDYNVYVGADPRTGKMKIFSTVKKEALEAQGWCEGFGLVCAFNWSFYGAEYNAPVWAKEYELGNVYLTIKELKKVVEDDGTAADVIASLEETMSNIEDLEEGDIKDAIEEAKATISEFIYTIAEEEYENMEDQWDAWKRNSKEEFNASYYPMSAYNEYIAPGATLILNILDLDDTYDLIEDVTNYFGNKEANIAAFEASHNKHRIALPLEYRNLNRGDMTIEVALGEPVNGFRWTLMENHSNKTNNAGYPFTSFTELEIFDADGNKVALTEDLITTNSLQGGEGTIAGLVDGITKAEDYQGEAPYGWYWHAIWGGGAHNPDGEAYLDIRFPSGVELSQFTIKGYSRSGQEHNAPKTAVISEYGREHDSTGEEEVNPYTVTLGEKVIDLTQIKDGGLYAIQGNLEVNMSENASEPRFYAGVAPSNNTAENLDETNVYMFKKVGDAWNILSLNDGKYWIDAPDYGESNLSLYKAAAANVKFVASQNLENTFVIYSEIDSTLSAKFEWTDEKDSTNVIKIDSTGVKANSVVYMDWAGGLASRPCYSPIPGEIDPQFVEKLAGNEGLKVTGGAGDYLHFNKTNGEGEWTIYEVEMNDPYFLYLTKLVDELDNLKLNPGKHPGCIMAEDDTKAAFENAKAAAIVAVDNNKKEKAEALATALIEAIDELSKSERVGFDPEAIYRIESAYQEFKKLTWYTRSIYAGDEKLAWTVTPDNFEEENQEFLFNIIEITDEIAAEHRIDVTESMAGNAYVIKNIGKDKFIGTDWSYATRGVAHLIVNLEACEYNIKNEGGQAWHAEWHSSGNGYGSTLCYYGGGVNSASSWTFIDTAVIEDNTSVEDLVVEGDEVVSVSYFTPAGTAIPAPVKGINIVVTVYANGVVEAKKILVK